jgi:hypothetical protein
LQIVGICPGWPGLKALRKEAENPYSPIPMWCKGVTLNDLATADVDVTPRREAVYVSYDGKALLS